MAGCGHGAAPAACIKESDLVLTVRLIPLAIVHVETRNRLTKHSQRCRIARRLPRQACPGLNDCVPYRLCREVPNVP